MVLPVEICCLGLLSCQGYNFLTILVKTPYLGNFGLYNAKFCDFCPENAKFLALPVWKLVQPRRVRRASYSENLMQPKQRHQFENVGGTPLPEIWQRTLSHPMLQYTVNEYFWGPTDCPLRSELEIWCLESQTTYVDSRPKFYRFNMELIQENFPC